MVTLNPGKRKHTTHRRRWKVIFTKSAQKDAKKLAAAGLKVETEQLLELLSEDPFRTPPPFEKLIGDLVGAHSRRISIQHRLVSQVLKKESTVKVVRMWTHYQ